LNCFFSAALQMMDSGRNEIDVTIRFGLSEGITHIFPHSHNRWGDTMKWLASADRIQCPRGPKMAMLLHQDVLHGPSAAAITWPRFEWSYGCRRIPVSIAQMVPGSNP